MKELIKILLVSTVLVSCNGLGLRQNIPKRDMTVSGYFLKEGQNNYYLIQRSSADGQEFFNEHDTLTIDGQLYHDVYFAKLDPDKFENGYNHLNYNFGNRVVMYVRGNFERKQIPGEGSREYLVLDNVVGVE